MSLGGFTQSVLDRTGRWRLSSRVRNAVFAAGGVCCSAYVLSYSGRDSTDVDREAVNVNRAALELAL
jgi:hypothetical protein